MEVRAATEARVSLGSLASHLPLDPQSAATPCLTDASSAARASPFLLPSNRNMEVRVATPPRVSLGIVASDRNLELAERDLAVPHGRTVEGASHSVSAPNRARTWRYAPRRRLA